MSVSCPHCGTAADRAWRRILSRRVFPYVCSHCHGRSHIHTGYGNLLELLLVVDLILALVETAAVGKRITIGFEWAVLLALVAATNIVILMLMARARLIPLGGERFADRIDAIVAIVILALGAAIMAALFLR